MEELIKIVIIYGIIMFLINALANKGRRNKNNEKRMNRKVIYEKRINKNGEITNIKRTYTNGEIDENVIEGNDILQEDVFGQSILGEKSNEMAELLNRPNKRNNNRHSYMYQNIEEEIIKVDHTFSKEVFLNNARELFLKYKDSMVKGDLQELKQYATEEFINIIQDRIDYNKQNDISVVVEKFNVYSAMLYEFSKSTENQVITIKIKVTSKSYEMNNRTQFITKGNKYATVDMNYEMQFIRKIKDTKCQGCGAPVNMKNLSVCEYCNTPIKVENNEWKLNYINILKD